nr:hypothetical protein Iba_chr05eCG9250 [Ipomoea batatas]
MLQEGALTSFDHEASDGLSDLSTEANSEFQFKFLRVSIGCVFLLLAWATISSSIKGTRGVLRAALCKILPSFLSPQVGFVLSLHYAELANTLGAVVRPAGLDEPTIFLVVVVLIQHVLTSGAQAFS